MIKNSKGQMELSKETKSIERRNGESEMDYYERRYKERVII